MGTVRVMTWNIQSGHSTAGQYVIDAQGRFIKSLAPDIIMLQEVADALSNNSNAVDQTEFLAQAVGLNHHHYWMLEDWRGVRGGIALLSRWPLVDIEQVPVPRPWYTYLPWSYEGQRGILSGSVVIDGSTWRLRCTHMPHNGGQYLTNHTRLLAQQAAQTPTTMWPVLGGDFNLGQNDPAFDDLHQYMNVAAGVAGEIDLVWVGKSAIYKAAVAGKVDGHGLSDHDPTLVNLELTNPAPQPAPASSAGLRARVEPRTVAEGTHNFAVFAEDSGSGARVQGRVISNTNNGTRDVGATNTSLRGTFEVGLYQFTVACPGYPEVQVSLRVIATPGK